MSFISPETSRTTVAPGLASRPPTFSICTATVPVGASTGHEPDSTLAQLRPYVGTPICTLRNWSAGTATFT